MANPYIQLKELIQNEFECFLKLLKISHQNETDKLKLKIVRLQKSREEKKAELNGLKHTPCSDPILVNQKQRALIELSEEINVLTDNANNFNDIAYYGEFRSFYEGVKRKLTIIESQTSDPVECFHLLVKAWNSGWMSWTTHRGDYPGLQGIGLEIVKKVEEEIGKLNAELKSSPLESKLEASESSSSSKYIESQNFKILKEAICLEFETILADTRKRDAVEFAANSLTQLKLAIYSLDGDYSKLKAYWVRTGINELSKTFKKVSTFTLFSSSLLAKQKSATDRVNEVIQEIDQAEEAGAELRPL